MSDTISINAKQVSRIAKGLRQTSRPAWLALRKRLREIGNVVADDARQRAPQSGRIVIKANPTAAGNIRVSVIGTPGVAIENNGKGFVRHPIPHTDKWTSKNSKPAFLLPAYAAKREWALAEMEKAYLDAFDRAWAAGGER